MAMAMESGFTAETAFDLVQQVTRDLERVPAVTEQSFLSVGATLQGLCLRLQEIAEKSATAAAFMSGGEILSLIEGLGATLDRIEAQAADADQKAELTVRRFIGMRHGLDGVCRLMAKFQERVATLRMMKTLTNIQSASLGGGGRGFRNVAADIGKLSQNVQAKSSGVILKTGQLNADLERALGMVNGLAAKQRHLGRAVVDTIRQGIGSLAAMHEKCTGAAVCVSDRSGEISREIAEVVVAMQFHDITRQQMEHARESLAAVGAPLRKVAGVTRGLAAEDAECGGIAELEAVCELQAAQLANTVDELLSAVARIVANLRKISGNAADASTRVHELSGLADRLGRSSMGEIENGLASVLALFAENVATNRALTGVMVSVTTAMGEIAAFLEDIDYIGSEIRLIALNAIIKAAQAGSGGAALTVIAQTVERQSEEICQQVAVITGTILEITGCLEELREELGEGATAATRAADMESLRSELGSFMDSLKVLNDTVMVLLADTDRAAVSLAAEVEGAIGEIQLQDGAAALQSDVIPRLNALVLTARRLKRNRRETDAREGVDAAQRRYTMRSERNVHAAFVSSAGRGADAAFAPLAGGALPCYGENGLGDNVELF